MATILIDQVDGQLSLSNWSVSPCHIDLSSNHCGTDLVAQVKPALAHVAGTLVGAHAV
jgi:hypothetical protein